MSSWLVGTHGRKTLDNGQCQPASLLSSRTSSCRTGACACPGRPSTKANGIFLRELSRLIESKRERARTNGISENGRERSRLSQNQRMGARTNENEQACACLALTHDKKYSKVKNTVKLSERRFSKSRGGGDVRQGGGGRKRPQGSSQKFRCFPSACIRDQSLEI